MANIQKLFRPPFCTAQLATANAFPFPHSKFPQLIFYWFRIPIAISRPGNIECLIEGSLPHIHRIKKLIKTYEFQFLASSYHYFLVPHY